MLLGRIDAAMCGKLGRAELPCEAPQLAEHRGTCGNGRQHCRKRDRPCGPIDDQAERAAVVPDDRERRLCAARNGRTETAEHPAIDVPPQDRLDDSRRIHAPLSACHQCWNPVMPGSNPIPPPGGYSRAELNSLFACTLINAGSPCFEATS